MLLRGRRRIVVSDAEYELILSQPINMRQFPAGKTLYAIIEDLIALPLCFAFMPMTLDLNKWDPKGYLLPISVVIALFALVVSIDVVAAVNNALEKLGYRKLLTRVFTAYLIAGFIHSILIKNISPLLFYLFRPLFEALIYPFTISETIDSVTVSIVKSLIIVITLLTLLF